MIKAIIFDIDNTLMDFMRMKRAADGSPGGTRPIHTRTSGSISLG